MYRTRHRHPWLGPVIGLLMTSIVALGDEPTLIDFRSESGRIRDSIDITRWGHYPEDRRLAGFGGYAIVRLRIDQRGNVEELSTLAESSPAFGRAARLALASLRYAPATAGGASWQTADFRVDFDLVGDDRHPRVLLRSPSYSREVPLVFTLDPADEGTRTPMPERKARIVRPEAGDEVVEVDVDVPARYDTATLAASLRYPEEALERRLEADVVVLALVDRDGSVASAVVKRSESALFNDEALRRVKALRFTPALVGGAPFAVWVEIPVRFRLPR